MRPAARRREHDHVHGHAVRQQRGRAHVEPPVDRLGGVRRRLYGDAVRRHARRERVDAHPGRRPDLGDVDGDGRRRRDRRGGRVGRAHRPGGRRLQRRVACGRHRVDRRQRRGATVDRRPDRHRGEQRHDHGDNDRAAVGPRGGRGDGDRLDGGRVGARRQRLPGEDRRRSRSPPARRPRAFHGQHRQQPHRGADRDVHSRALGAVGATIADGTARRHDSRQRRRAHGVLGARRRRRCRADRG